MKKLNSLIAEKKKLDHLLTSAKNEVNDLEYELTSIKRDILDAYFEDKNVNPKKAVGSVLGSIRSIEKQVVLLRVSTYIGYKMSYEEIGAELGVHRVTASKYFKDTSRKINHPARSSRLEKMITHAKDASSVTNIDEFLVKGYLLKRYSFEFNLTYMLGITDFSLTG
ncbi:hypothetical protein N9H77_02025 [Porticoccaceae bacterium]|nr:hypothetical protein [Porticoccaceae bacterium]